MLLKVLLQLLYVTALAQGKRILCDQTPPMASILEPGENKNIYKLTLVTKEKGNYYLPDQTYVLKLKALDEHRPFRSFMITVEDPDVEKQAEDLDFDWDQIEADVGTLKTLDSDSNRKSIHSNRCRNSVENADYSDKYEIEVLTSLRSQHLLHQIHWISPKQSDTEQKVRLRAMVAENSESWFIGENLTIVLQKNSNKAADTPPVQPTETCNLCSEARYEIIFHGKWSKATHPRHYPSKPDDNGYSHLIGASHSFLYTLWQQGQRASKGLKILAEESNVTLIEREIIDKISPRGGTRTLIRGRRRHHPEMSEPSHSLFRVDRIHHLFSIAVGMSPSPDWFLGTSKFELCTESGWLKSYTLPLYPWDAGTMDGISYESEKTMTQPTGNIERVAVGSFDQMSPFYQMNLNDLKPFAIIEINRLDVFPLIGVDCSVDDKEEIITTSDDDETENTKDSQLEPKASEWRPDTSCKLEEWGEWSPCRPHRGVCGAGTQVRVRDRKERSYSSMIQDSENLQTDESCQLTESTSQSRDCVIKCDMNY